MKFKADCNILSPGPFYLVGGGLHGEVGFVGCVSDLSVDGERKVVREYERSSEEEVVVGECSLTNWCSGVECEHGGVCRQQSSGRGRVFCDYELTGGYSGGVCHSSHHWRSCQQFLQFSHLSEGQIVIDPDGSGPLEPVMVQCHVEDERFVTSVSHTNPEPTKVDGFQAPGSFSQAIQYSAPDSLVELLTSTASSCWQSLRYDCLQSGLLGRPWGWWVSWAGERQQHWAGATPGSRRCQCGERGDCLEEDKVCNCDSNTSHWTSDHGVIRDKLLLPVTRLHFGDTGTPLDRKEGRFTLGPLSCSHHTGGHRRGRVSLGRSGGADTDQCPEIFLELLVAGQLSGELYQLVTGHLLCRLTVLPDNLLVYEWGQHGALANLSIALPELGLADGRWHSVNIEHNSLEVAVVVDRETVVTYHHHNISRDPQQSRDSNSYYLMVSRPELLIELQIHFTGRG